MLVKLYEYPNTNFVQSLAWLPDLPACLSEMYMLLSSASPLIVL